LIGLEPDTRREAADSRGTVQGGYDSTYRHGVIWLQPAAYRDQEGRAPRCEEESQDTMRRRSADHSAACDGNTIQAQGKKPESVSLVRYSL